MCRPLVSEPSRLWIDAFKTFQMLLYGRTQDVWTQCRSKGDTCEPVLQYIPITQIVMQQNPLGILTTSLNNDLKKRFCHISCDAKSSETVSEKKSELNRRNEGPVSKQSRRSSGISFDEQS